MSYITISESGMDLYVADIYLESTVRSVQFRLTRFFLKLEFRFFRTEQKWKKLGFYEWMKEYF